MSAPRISKPRPFVFLDRDGTLVRDPGYVHRLEDYALLPGVVTGLRLLLTAGFDLAIVTNQSGIARGFYREASFSEFQAHLEADLARQGVRIAGSFFCPHLPAVGCDCRKPAPGMLFAARDQLAADLSASFVIGNHWTDVETAQAAGCAGAVLIADAPPPRLPPLARIASSFEEAAAWVAKALNSVSERTTPSA